MQGLYDGNAVKLGRGPWLGASFSGLGLKVGLEDAVALPLQEVPRKGVKTALDGLQALGIPQRMLTAIIHEAPVLARGAMFEGPLLLDAHR